MEWRRLGASGLKVPALCLGTATFGGGSDFFAKWGNTQLAEARRMVDICLEAGLNLFDTANVYSHGLAEDILGKALDGRREHVLIATKATFPMGLEPNDFGSSRLHLMRSCEASLRRLRTDYIDIYHMHGFDGLTPVEETLRTLDDLVGSGKVRYVACSNFSAWQLMKSLAVAERHGWSKYVAHQAYYSLVGREFEWELMPLGRDQGVGTIVWSPLAGGALTGKVRRHQPAPAESRVGTLDFIPFDREGLFNVVDVLEDVAKECDKTIAQVAINWILQRPNVASVVIGARNETQLRQNLGAVGWSLDDGQMARLDAVSEIKPAYPYWHQRSFQQLQPETSAFR